MGEYSYPDGKPRNTSEHQTQRQGIYSDIKTDGSPNDRTITAPATDLAKTWDGWGTALKPAWEPIILARKPRGKTYRECAVEHGAGALWVDGCRVGVDTVGARPSNQDGITRRNLDFAMKEFEGNPTQGRWPANLILSHHPDCVRVGVKRVKPLEGHRPNPVAKQADGRIRFTEKPAGYQKVSYTGEDGLETVEDWICVEGCPIRMLDEQSGNVGGRWGKHNGQHPNSMFWGEGGPRDYDIAASCERFTGDTRGGASRFFYTAKASRSERNAGLEDFWFEGKELSGGGGTEGQKADAYQARKTSRHNPHPTVKPIALTEYLARLIRPPEEYLDDAVILIPFCGSGSEIIGAIRAGWRNWLGIEISEEYAEIARARIAYWQEQVEADRQKQVQLEMEV